MSGKFKKSQKQRNPTKSRNSTCRIRPSRPLYSRSRKACRKRRNASRKIPTSPTTTCNNILLLAFLPLLWLVLLQLLQQQQQQPQQQQQQPIALIQPLLVLLPKTAAATEFSYSLLFTKKQTNKHTHLNTTTRIKGITTTHLNFPLHTRTHTCAVSHYPKSSLNFSAPQIPLFLQNFIKRFQETLKIRNDNHFPWK